MEVMSISCPLEGRLGMSVKSPFRWDSLDRGRFYLHLTYRDDTPDRESTRTLFNG